MNECLHCGEDKKTNETFCSLSCAVSYNNKNRKRKKTHDKLCLCCGKPLKNKRNKFCDRSCSTTYNNKGLNRHKTPDKFCLCCNKKLKNKSSKFCSTTCCLDYQENERLNEWKNNGVFPGRGTIKKYLLDKQGGACSCCGNEQIWNGKPLVLELEHKDGNSENNVEENLELLCPNCHSQTDTYKAKNKGNGRFNRRKRYNEGQSY